MRIQFIYPNFSSSQSADAMQPLVFGILARLTPPDIEVSLFDERVEDINFESPADLIAISVQTFSAKRAYHIADIYRSKDIPVVLGGFHPTLLPDEASAHADSVVIGDAEGVWEKVVADVKKQQLQKRYRADHATVVQPIIPNRSIFKGKNYIKILPVQFTRGCRFSCDFCSIHAFYGKSVRQRSVYEVVEEIRNLNSKHVMFVDDNLITNHQNAKKLLKALIPLKIKWVGEVSIDAARDPSMLDAMKKSGCKGVFIGFESMQHDNLKQMKKPGNVKWGYIKAVHEFKSRCIMVAGSFIFGYDRDTVETFHDILNFALDSKLCMAHFNPLFPTPGTEVYESLKKQKRLIYKKWWLSPDYRYGQALFHPRNITHTQLEDGCFQLRKKFNTYPAIIKRMLDFKANCSSLYNIGLFMKLNLLTRKEIFSKQGLKLG